MTGPASALLHTAAVLLLCLTVLLMLRRAAAAHRRNMARLDEVQRTLAALHSGDAKNDRGEAGEASGASSSGRTPPARPRLRIVED